MMNFTPADGDAFLERQERLRHRLMQMAAALAGALIVGAIVIGYIVFVRLPNDEHKTCVVQSRGLQAQRHLTKVMSAISEIIAEPPVPHPQTPKYLIAPLADLRRELPKYVALERKQPPKRNC